MNDEQDVILVIESNGGDRYAVPKAVLDQFRLPSGSSAEKAEVEGFAWGWNFWWSTPTQLVGQDGASLVGQDGASWGYGNWWG